MSVSTEVTQAIYNLSAITRELEKIEESIDPTSSSEVKEQIADIQTKVTALQSSLSVLATESNATANKEEIISKVDKSINLNSGYATDIINAIPTVTSIQSGLAKDDEVYSVGDKVSSVSSQVSSLDQKLGNLATSTQADNISSLIGYAITEIDAL